MTAASPTHKPTISLIIPAYNEEVYLPWCLDAVMANVAGLAHEVIVVDNNSTDSTKAVIARYPGVTYLFEEQKGITRAEYGSMMNPLGKPPRTVWQIVTQKRKEAHFSTFPDELARRCILAGCPKGGMVLDPFAGRGTTGVVALELARQFLGIELVTATAALARRCLQATHEQARADG